MTVKMIARKTVTGGDVEKVIPAQLAIIETSMQFEGAISIEMYRCIDDPNAFVLIEEWASWESLTAWINSGAVADYRREHEPDGTLEIDWDRLEQIL